MTVDLALLVVRLVVGGFMIGHGAQKLFGLFGGPGLAGTTGWLASMGLRPAGLWALAAGLAEFGGGLLLALGLLTPLAGLAVVASMAMAALLVHRGKGVWVTNGGWEYNAVLVTVGLALVLSGPGAYSLDATLGVAVAPVVTIIVALLALLGVTAALAGRRAPEEQRA